MPFKWRGKYLCFFCGADFKTYETLREHTTDHGNCSDKDRALIFVKSPDVEVKIDVSRIVCNICNEIIPNLESTISHLVIEHNLAYDNDVALSLAPYKLSDLSCLFCDLKFNYFSKLINHVNNDHPSQTFICDQCHQRFNKKRDLDAHIRIKHRANRKCTTCFQDYPPSEILKHKRKLHSTKCNICFRSFISFKTCFNHIKNYHAESALKCGFCLNFETTKKKFLQHVIKCRELNETSDAITTSIETKSSIKHLRNGLACIFNMSTAIPFKYFMSRFRCFYCPKDFNECDDLKQHTVIEHPLCDTKLKSMKLRHRHDGVIKIDTSTLSCKICFEQLSNLNTLVDHLHCEHKIYFDKAVTTNLQSYKLVKDNFPCPFCGEVYTYFRTLLKHVAKTHSDNKNICVNCGMSFRNAPNLRTHIARHHKTANHKCSKCDLRFSTNNYLQTHLGRVHGSKVVGCSQCQEKFTSFHAMQRHKIQIHRTGHECSICHKLFVGKSCLINHVRRTHLKEKNVICTICRETFFDGHSLKVHMVKHKGERNFHCDICGKKFLWKKNLRGHMATHNKTFNNDGPNEHHSTKQRRKNLEIIFNNTSIIPFRWRGTYLCFYCGQEHTEYTAFRKHTKSHGLCSSDDSYLKAIKGENVKIRIDISKMVCVICYEELSSFNEIIDHLIGKHELEYDRSVFTPLQEFSLADGRCQLCDKKFAYCRNLISHMYIAHPFSFFTCDCCGKNFWKKKDLARHIMRFHREGGYLCDECPEKFDQLALLSKHKNLVHGGTCKFCNTIFPSYNLLQKHIKNDHDDGSNHCLYCHKKILTKRHLKVHLTKCPLNKKENKSVVKTEGLLQPIKKQNIYQIRRNIQTVLNMSTAVPFKFFTKFSCFYCSKHFIEFDELKEHTVAEHPVCDLKEKYMKNRKGGRVGVKIDVSSLSCKICYEAFEDIELLIDHLIRNHSVDYDKSVTGCFETFSIVKDNIPCPICSTVFRYFGTLLRHINAEHGNNKKICDFCGRAFNGIPNLAVHKMYAHTGACECKICAAKFKNQWCLGRHMAKIHDAKEYKCPECPERFRSHYHKQKHLIAVHNTGHKCTHCGKMFTRNSFMQDHVRRTHLKEKNVPCSVCGEKFFDNYLLKLHMVKHKGERNFPCDVCGKAFYRRSNLNSHKRMHTKYGLD